MTKPVLDELGECLRELGRALRVTLLLPTVGRVVEFLERIKNDNKKV